MNKFTHKVWLQISENMKNSDSCRNILKLFLGIFFYTIVSFPNILFAQVSDVSYKLKYNPDSCRYEAFLIINAGSTSNIAQRTQAFTKFSVVVPTGTNINVIENYFPLNDNEAFTGTIPNDWIIYSAVGAPIADPVSDYYIFAPSFDTNSHYNNLDAGDTIPLFSLYVDTIFNCGQGIRMYKNGIDPDQNAPGMGFINFNNNFNLVEGGGIYSSNAISTFPSPPIISPLLISCQSGIEIQASATTSVCQTPLKYTWTGPNGFYASSQNLVINPAHELNSGEYKVLVSDKYGCVDSLAINAQNKPYAGMDMLVCANTTVSLSGSDPSDGTWSSDSANNIGATLTNTAPGLANVSFDQNAAGIYKFIYSTQSCSDTVEVGVNSLPDIVNSGPDSLCIGDTTTLSPGTGGYWISSDPNVASINSGGIVTALTSGNVSFSFTELLSGCTSFTNDITVNPTPVISIVGSPEVCVGSSTQILPSSGGTWNSMNPGIVNIINTGLITGISEGITTVIFTDSITGCVSAPKNIVVKPIPSILITGPNNICVQAISQLSPNSGGSWESLQPQIASISSSGIVNAIAPGIVNFRWTETSTGCSSAISGDITVVPQPFLNYTAHEVCIGNYLLITTNDAGTWTSNNPSVATILSGSGLVTGISAGRMPFTFNRLSDFCTIVSDSITINPRPSLSSSKSELCIGSTASLSPNSGGIWSSLDESIISVFGSIAVGSGSGFVTLRYEENNTGCENTILMNVSERAVVTILDKDTICTGSTTQLSPTSGGTWAISNTNVALISQTGMVTGVASGTATFIFTENSTGCNSLPSSPVSVKPLPQIYITGPDSICTGSNTLISSISTGLWVSSNPGVASIDATTGTITGNSPGLSSFTLTETISGCTSLPSNNIVVKGSPELIFSGPSIICTGGISQLMPNNSGNWISNNPTVATITNTGQITGLSAGSVTFTYTDSGLGCNIQDTSDVLIVTNCFTPDFNVTNTNISVNGDLSTNDQEPLLNNYSNATALISGPPGAISSLNVNSSGGYTFVGNKQGVYKFEIPVCVSPQVSGCPNSSLSITVKDNDITTKIVSTNVDIVGTAYNTPIIIKSLDNDACILVEGCSLNPSSVAITTPPGSGNVSVNSSNGDITFTPVNGFTGMVYFTYKVCSANDALVCDTANVIITVLGPNPVNSLILTDDLAIGKKGVPLVGNALSNDTDPDGNTLNVTSQDITTSEGQFTINNNGLFTFIPGASFIGSVNFTYEVCDNHINSICKKATIYILVLPELSINIKVYLEGALMNNGNAVAGGRPLMRDNLRMSPFTGGRLIPDSDPYFIPSSFVNISSKFVHKGSGSNTEFNTIQNPSAVFSVSGRNAIVDWVFIELRSKTDKSNVVATRSALLQRDGDVVDIDGVSSLRFPGIAIDSYYVAVRHRNHLGAMTMNIQSPTQLSDTIDFSSPSTLMFDFGTSKNNGYNYTGLAQKPNVKSGFMSLWAGDFDSNRKVKGENPNDDLNYSLFDVLFYPLNMAGNANYDLAIGYFQGDYDLNSKAKFDNPNDDKNMLYGQILFYPLNINFISNFDFLIEQLP